MNIAGFFDIVRQAGAFGLGHPNRLGSRIQNEQRQECRGHHQDGGRAAIRLLP
jgi:hypothetical protein